MPYALDFWLMKFEIIFSLFVQPWWLTQFILLCLFQRKRKHKTHHFLCSRKELQDIKPLSQYSHLWSLYLAKMICIFLGTGQNVGVAAATFTDVYDPRMT